MFVDGGIDSSRAGNDAAGSGAAGSGAASPGAASPGAPAVSRARSRGFTLLEMMVVLVIAGLLVSLASVSLRRNPHTDLNEEAQRLALLFETASDEAQVRSRPIAWHPVGNGYRFDVRTEDGWSPLLRDDLLRQRAWEGGVTDVTIDYPGSDLHPDRLVFGVESIGQAVTVTLYSSVGRATIIGTGNGRYEVR